MRVINRIQVLVTLAMILCATPVLATDLYVETTGDNQEGANACTSELTPCLTLAHALTQAGENDVIHLGEGDFVETADLDVVVPVTIAGAGRFVTTVTNENFASNLFEIEIPNTFVDPLVTIKDVRITPSADGGFCLRHFGDSVADKAAVDLTIQDVYFYSCSVEDGAAIFYTDAGELTVERSEFASNYANNASGGSIFSVNSSVVSITDSYFSDNSAREVGSAVALDNVLSVVVTNSTFANNRVTNLGQGAFACFNCLSAVLQNVTFSENFGSEAPDEVSDIYISNTNLSLSHVTVYNSSNADDYLISQTASTISSTHSVVYQVDDHAECNEVFATADAFNLSDGTDCFADANDIIEATDPFEGVILEDNGGPVLTLEVLLSSSAYNAGDVACPLETDARGADRPANGKCDIGAFEASCGNAVVEAEYGEACDDGDVLDGDGCSSTCQNESTWYQDLDDDTFGNPEVSVMAVENPENYVSDNTDCDDNNAEISPDGVDDQCDGVDNNCDGTTDDDFADVLGDSCSSGVGACAETGEIQCTDDATDTECNAVASDPEAEECSDDVDNDCDGETDVDDSDCVEATGDDDDTEITDTDADGIADDSDNCPDDSNADQLDTDEDGEGDECETSSSGGGCSLTANGSQAKVPFILCSMTILLLMCLYRLTTPEESASAE